MINYLNDYTIAHISHWKSAFSQILIISTELSEIYQNNACRQI